MIARLQRLIFVHVPKCAGMAVEAALGGLPARQNPEQHWTGKQLSRAYPDEWASFHRFAVVRHPLARALSYVRFIRRFDPIWRRHLDHVPEDVLLRDTLFSHNTLTTLSAHAMLTGEEEVLHLEDLDATWPAFAERHGLPRALPRKNHAPEAPHAPLPPVCAHLVAAMFPEDHGRFGYALPTDPIASLSPRDQGAVAWARLQAWGRRRPERATAQAVEEARAWLAEWRASLPDPEWIDRYDALVRARPPALDTARETQAWVERLHEDVNVALGKPPWKPWSP